MNTDPEATTEAEIHRCLMQALELGDRGEAVDLEELCSGRKDVMDAVSSALRRAPVIRQLGPAAAAGVDPWIGQRLGGRYEMSSRLGAGGMGVVYRATDLELGRPVAIKLLRSDLFLGDSGRERFAREAGALAAVANPAVVSVFDRGETDEGVAYLVMEFVDGSPLSTILNRAEELAKKRGGVERLDDTDWLTEFTPGRAGLEDNYLRVVVGWIADIADGLQAAHDAGILHRDVKPSNVMIRRDGRAMLADFGIAVALQSGTLTTRERGLGTPAYMAPEQLHTSADAHLSEAIDIYGLAATLYHCVTLRPPYDGTPSQVFAALGRREPMVASSLRPGLPRDLQAILDLAMRRKPEGRYPAVSALSADLRAFLAYRPVRARPVSRLVRFWRRRTSEIRVALGVAALAGLGIGSFVAWQGLVRDNRDRIHELYRWLPPLQDVSAVPMRRVIEDPKRRQATRQRLDELVDRSDSAMPPRLMRAAFRLDHGDPGGAAEDMTALADELGTPYVVKLAERFRALPATAKEASEVDLEGLPAPATPAERRIAAYRRLRWCNDADVVARCAELLDNGNAPRSFWTRSLELMVQLCLAMELPHTDPRRIPSYRRVYQDARELEASYGAPTAATVYFQFVALTGHFRDREALELYETAKTLLPDEFGIHLARGSSLRRLGRYDEAVEAVRAAMRKRPESTKPHNNLVNIYMSSGDHRAALRVIAESSLTGSRWDHMKTTLLARVGLDRAIDLWAAGDRDGSRDEARRALPVFESIEDTEIERLFCRAVLAVKPAERSAVAADMLGWLAQHPASGIRIQNVGQLLPETLDAESVRQLKKVMEVLAGMQVRDQ